MPPLLLPRSANCLLFLLSFLPIILPFPSAAVPCDSSHRDLISEAFKSVRGLNKSLLRSLAFVNCSSDGAVELHLPRSNLSGSVSWTVLANLTGLRVVDLSGNALEGHVPPAFFASASSLLHIDLSSNELGGTIRLNASPSVLSSPLLTLNLSSNRFTNQPFLSAFSGLRVLDLSGNNLSAMPEGIQGMKALEYLDLSWCNISRVDPRAFSGLGALRYLDLSGNGMNGLFPGDLPPLNRLQFLNLSRNNFSGVARAEQVDRFGKSAFMGSGVRTGGVSPPPKRGLSHKNESNSGPSTAGGGTHHQGPISTTQPAGKTTKKKENKPRKALILGLAIGGAGVLLAGAAAASAACCLYRRRERERKRKQWTITIPGTWKATRRGGGGCHSHHSSTPRSLDPEATWVAEASVSAPLVMFEKPLMELTFSDMVAATSGFGRESQLAEGPATGPVYRAVLPGEMDVAIKVLVRAREMEESQARAAVQELAGLKHPNLLPLVGYCIAGREKLLLLHQYMENGDLHRWLHELPLAAPAPSTSSSRMIVDDWAAGPADGGAAGIQGRAFGSTTAWASRYRIALGVARGLAFLHHAASGTPIVHGSVEASNVLLDESLEPRVAGLWPRSTSSGGEGQGQAPSVAGDVYGYGVVLLELLTGRVGSRDQIGRIRGMFKSGNGPAALDPRVMNGTSEEAEEKEMVEALRVAYLCTAEKQPSMRQVVGLLKDIRPLAV